MFRRTLLASVKFCLDYAWKLPELLAPNSSRLFAAPLASRNEVQILFNSLQHVKGNSEGSSSTIDEALLTHVLG